MALASTSSAHRALAVVVTASAIALLTGCVDAPATDPTTAPTETSTPTPSVTPGPTQEPSADSTPIDVACGDLVDPDAVYTFNPTLALLGEWTPDPGSAAAAALAADGVACRWVLESGGGTMDLSVAHLDEARLEQLKNAAFAAAEMVPTYGEEAYFDPATGTATVFQGPYWLVVTSRMFAEPGEPTEIIESAFAALP
jgi:hypothetical protein